MKNLLSSRNTVIPKISALITIFMMVLCVNSWGQVAFKATEPMPSNVSIGLTDEMGPVFVNDMGFALYASLYDDSAYHSKCNDTRYERVLGQGQAVNMLPNPETRPTCEQAYPPFRPITASANIGDNVGLWRVMERHDGSLQWAYKGKAVYLSSYDGIPGQLTGIRSPYGGDNIFRGRRPLYAPLALPVGMATRMNRHAGFTLTNAEGYTLYTSVELCDDDCEKVWQPVAAPAAIVSDKMGKTWGLKARKDGTRQWAYEGKPLYTFTGDMAPGEVKGQNVKGWAATILYRLAQPPEDITVQMTGDGEVFTDRNGKTLYAYSCVDEAPDHLPCDTPGAPDTYRLGICGTPDKCMETWRPVVASKGAKPVGHVWTIVPIDPTGKYLFAPAGEAVEPLMVWAYYGKPLFTFILDRGPGDIVGHNVMHLSSWGFRMVKR